MKQKTLHVIFQTHWDREWYFPFETFRGRLNLVVSRIIKGIDDGEFEFFILDGQTLPLLDYLETCDSGECEKFLRYIKQGQIIIGPWYIAMDEFLVQGESIIRNLELGFEISNSYAKPQFIGYLPDTFGHISQMPQILNQFGIDNAVMWRGIHIEDSEFNWIGADGSKVFTIYLTQGYYQPLLNNDRFIEDTKKYIELISPFATSEDILLTMGGDHLMPRDINMKTRMDDLSQQLDIKIKVTTFETYIKELKKKNPQNTYKEMKGELRNNNNAYILSNVWSTRIYLKQMNQFLEDEMIRVLEPLHALLNYSQINPQQKFLKYIWKLILQNQPHDSISGCSSDEVHKENELRYLKAKQTINHVYDEIFHRHGIYKQTFYHEEKTRMDSEETHHVVLNSDIHTFKGNLVFDLCLNEQYEGIKFNFNNYVLDGYVEYIKEERVFSSPLDYPPFFRNRFLHRVHLPNVTIPALSMSNLIFHEAFQVQTTKFLNSINNGKLHIKIEENGTLTIQDIEHHVNYFGIGQIISSLDVGDSYNYSRPIFDVVSEASLKSIIKAEKRGDVYILEYELVINQPQGVTKDRSAVKDYLSNVIHVKITTYHLASSIHLDIAYKNHAEDHRMRIIYPLKKIKSYFSDSAFDYVERTSRKETFEARKLKEVEYAIDPSLSSILVLNDCHYVHVMHRALHEFQIKETFEEDLLEMTLSRSIGFLSRDDFSSRGGAAGPNLSTPEAQVLRHIEHSFDMTFNDLDTPLQTLYNQINMYRYTPSVFKGNLKKDILTLIEINQEEIQLSALRYISQNQIELRLWNMLESECMCKFKPNPFIKTIIETDVMRKTKKEITNNSVLFKPKEIKTFLIKL